MRKKTNQKKMLMMRNGDDDGDDTHEKYDDDYDKEQEGFDEDDEAGLTLLCVRESDPAVTHVTIYGIIKHPMSSFIHSVIQAFSIAPLQVHYYSEVLPTQQKYCVGVSRRSATCNCE